MTTINRVAIVTGAGSGIGRSTSRALREAGFQLVLAGRHIDSLAETAGPASTHNTMAVETDVTAPASVKKLFAKAVQRFGRVDVLFNNAGTNIPGMPLEEVTIDQWRQVVDTNLTGAFLCTQEAIRTMKEQQPMGGRIINNGSISAHVPRPGSVAYTATKHAITGLTKSTSLDGRPYNVACGQIDIGNAETNMTARMKEGVPQADGSRAVEPTIDAEHIAQAVVYMAGLPLEANVQFMTVMATKMPYIGRG